MIKIAAMRIRLHRPERGSILVSILALAVVFTVIGLSLSSYAIGQHTITNRNLFAANALMAAEAGIEQSLHQLNQDDAFVGYTTEQEFFDNAIQGRGVYTTVVADTADTNAKTITATGKTYRQSSPTTPVSTRIVKVTVVGTESEGYSVMSGPGGLILGGSANITNSDVYVNGTITLTGAARIGTNSQPLSVNVANQACPTGASPGPTYPQVCSSGQPISMEWSTNIYGSVCATGQTSTGPNNNIKPGVGGQGLIAGCVAPPVSQPSYDRAAHIASMTTTAAGNSNTYTCQSWPFNRTWPDGLRLNGNVTIGGSCNVTINGDAYITGNLTINGAARVTVANSMGTTRPVIVVDGTITTGGSAQIITNSSGTGIYFISFRSSASCNPNCTSLSGNDLKTSQNLLTVDVGGAVNLPGMLFQAYWGRLRLAGSGNIGSAAGQTVDLSGAGTITFGTELSTGSKTWTITSYQQVFQ
ncbi:MAG TPA: hypothetical protein VJ836_07895 [Candidatus Saccharimonadales bacterium]|nr:hypothetical protein [Candidatus Saccharimonadales bacterium]